MPDLNQININITDTIPPENFATVDTNALVGSVYTKTQDNEWRKEVEATVQSGIKGVLKPNTPYDPITNPYPTPWVAGNSPLYEKYDVNQVGPFPNTKDVNDENIVVTQNELDLNEVQIWVKNGVAQKFLKAMPQASVNIRQWEELQTNNFPLNEGYQVIYNNGYWMVDENKLATMTDLPGESDIWNLIGSSDLITTDISKVKQPTLLFTDQYISYAVVGNSYGVSPNGGWKVWSVTVSDFIKFKLHASLVDNTGKLIGIKGSDIVTEVFPITSKDYDGEEFTITNSQTEKIIIASKNSGFQTYISVADTKTEIWGKDKVKEIYLNSAVGLNVNVTPNVYSQNKQFPSNAPVGVSIDSYNNSDPNADIYLVPILPNKVLKIKGRFGIDNGLSLLDINKSKLHLLKVGEGYMPGVLREFDIITNDLPIESKYIAVNPYRAGGLTVIEISDKTLYPMQNVKERLDIVDSSIVDIYQELANGGGGGGGVEIIFDKSIYLLKKGLKESNTAAQNTLIINAAMLQARNERKSIYIPEGIYRHNSIDFYPVNIYGKDRNTVLFNESTQPSFNMVGNSGGENIKNMFTNQNGIEVGNFILDGGNTSARGFSFGSPLAFSAFERLVFRNFTGHAVFTLGMLICNWRDIYITNCQNGFRADSGSYIGEGFETNLCTFRDIVLSSIPKLGIHWNNGASVLFDNLDAEVVGTLNDVNTGVLQYDNMGSYPNGKGLTVTNSWCERLMGDFYLKINNAGVHNITNTYIDGASGVAGKAVINNGSKLSIGSTHITGFTQNVITNGAGAKTFVDGSSVIGNHTETNGGQYLTSNYS